MSEQFVTGQRPFATLPIDLQARQNPDPATFYRRFHFMTNPMPEPNATGTPQNASPGTPAAHVVLYHPEIPQNTGNIGRSCVAVGAKLWIVEPAAFELSEKRVRRAGLDYWKHLELECVDRWQTLATQFDPRRTFFLSRFADRLVWDAQFRPGDAFVFGSESSGLPAEIMTPSHPQALRLPTSDKVRSLNLATTVGIILFEQQRQIRLAEARG
jgi:tRNA (cytidine/uridine-2'-O-)-methyltransferase